MNAGRNRSESRARYADRTLAAPASGNPRLGDGHEAHALRVTQRDTEAAAPASRELSARKRLATPGARAGDVEADVAGGEGGAPGDDQVVAAAPGLHVAQVGERRRGKGAQAQVQDPTPVGPGARRAVADLDVHAAGYAPDERIERQVQASGVGERARAVGVRGLPRAERAD